MGKTSQRGTSPELCARRPLRAESCPEHPLDFFSSLQRFCTLGKQLSGNGEKLQAPNPSSAQVLF